MRYIATAQVSRTVRIFFAALFTALLLYYHTSILSYTGLTSASLQSETATIIQIPIPHKGPSTSSGGDDSSIQQDASLPLTSAAPGSGSSATVGDDDDSLATTSTDAAASDDDGDDSAFNEVKFAFQDDLTGYRMPKLDVAKLKQYSPHNDHGTGQFAFATYLSTRNNSLHDPYFLSAQQLVYRLLWDPKSRSAWHPVVVFVAPFIPKEQRDLLLAQGAIVRELELVPWDPPANEDGSIFPFARWKDLFSKLNIWAQTDLARVVFLDLDAFPVQNLDGIFGEDVAPRQKCRADLLPPADQAHAAEICDYVWAGHVAFGTEMNVGVVVLEPNKYMHARLLRESQDTTKFDNKMAEQAFLNYAFGPEGPFPPTALGREWNGYYPQEEEKDLLKVVHEKLWIFGDNTEWTKNIFRNGWQELLELYESPKFEFLRMQDGMVGVPGSTTTATSS